MFFRGDVSGFEICEWRFDCGMRNRTAMHRTLFRKILGHWFFATEGLQKSLATVVAAVCVNGSDAAHEANQPKSREIDQSAHERADVHCSVRWNIATRPG
jgi:hypothetical protein